MKPHITQNIIRVASREYEVDPHDFNNIVRSNIAVSSDMMAHKYQFPATKTVAQTHKKAIKFGYDTNR